MVTGSARTILVVEDDRDLVLSLEKRLTRAGFRVRTASTGAEALACVAANRVDAITLDVRLPDMSGIEVALALHDDPHTTGIPVVFVTAAADRHFRETCSGVGATYFIKKPFDNELLIETLRSLCAGREVNGASAETGPESASGACPPAGCAQAR